MKAQGIPVLTVVLCGHTAWQKWQDDVWTNTHDLDTRGDAEMDTNGFTVLHSADDPSATEESLYVSVETIKAYALGLRAWTRYHDSPAAQIATDMLYLIGEK